MSVTHLLNPLWMGNVKPSTCPRWHLSRAGATLGACQLGRSISSSFLCDRVSARLVLQVAGPSVATGGTQNVSYLKADLVIFVYNLAWGWVTLGGEARCVPAGHSTFLRPFFPTALPLLCLGSPSPTPWLCTTNTACCHLHLFLPSTTLCCPSQRRPHNVIGKVRGWEIDRVRKKIINCANDYCSPWAPKVGCLVLVDEEMG